jgi:REP element-mobilizing transposase RayT
VHDHERRYRLRAAVVMPDHVHVILTPLIDETRRTIIPLVEIMKAIKGASSHAINHRTGSQAKIWQEESFDRVIRSSESLDAKVAYILENPVRRGLVSNWREYHWVWLPPEEDLHAPPPEIGST